MVTITINERPIAAEAGETLLDVIRRAGIHVPTLCHLPGLPPSGACRLCSVEIEGRGNLVPSCAFPVADGLRVRTHSQRAVATRRTIVELLLANHPDDCNYCVRNNHCELQNLAAELGVRQRVYGRPRGNQHVDLSSPSLVRDPDKCILCGRCVRVCEEVQAVGAIDFVGRGCHTRIGTAFEEGLNVSSCVNCGQCVRVCPTGALAERSQLREVDEALRRDDLYVVVQHAPAVSVTLAEECGMKPGQDVNGVMNAAFRRLGFKRVFDTSFSADLTVMEEASELVERLTKGSGPLPLITSCSPGWVKYAEEFFPDMLAHLSSCKSPHQMLGAITKSYFAEREGLDPRQVFMVSVMPCTAKKFEAARPEMVKDGFPDVDAVLTTRELAQLIRMYNLDMASLSPELADDPFGERSSAGKLFGASGGVLEAALRTAHFLVTGQDMDNPKVSVLRGAKGVKKARLQVGPYELGVAAVSGLRNARNLLMDVRAGREDLHFIEIMACPGGCIGGGGQPLGMDVELARLRAQALYTIDRDDRLRHAHHNQSLKQLYTDFLGAPLGQRSHHLLHTHFAPREVNR